VGLRAAGAAGVAAVTGRAHGGNVPAPS
jgi:hypothetical protein